MTIDLPMITITEGIAQPYKQQAKVTNFWLSTNYMWEFLLRGGSTGKVWQEGADPGPPEEEDI